MEVALLLGTAVLVTIIVEGGPVAFAVTVTVCGTVVPLAVKVTVEASCVMLEVSVIFAVAVTSSITVEADCVTVAALVFCSQSVHWVDEHGQTAEVETSVVLKVLIALAWLDSNKRMATFNI